MANEMEHRLISGKGSDSFAQGIQERQAAMKPQLIMLGAITMLALPACQSSAPDGSATQPTRAQLAETDEDGVPMLVNAMCGSCHAVTAGDVSPLPQAPTFPAIANREELTRETLTAYLRDAHNYPDIMDVGLTDEDVALVTEYMVSLQDPDYRQPPS